MTSRIEELKKEGSVRGIDSLRVGIGLNTGPVTVGNLGSRSFMDYTVIGDTVNLGSRLEGLNKTYGTSIILSEFTAANLGDRFAVRELDRVKVKGKGEAVAIFELLGLREEIEAQVNWLMEAFEAALQLYRNREWDRAEAEFTKILKVYPGDGPCKLYMERIDELLENPPDEQWEPVCVFTTK
jgi:adenylate cyclase